MSTVTTSNSPGNKSGGLESVKYYVFDGEDEERWNEYSIKTLAFAEAKGWKEGLTEKDASDEKKRNAKNYLTMSLTGKAFSFISRSKEAYEVWNALMDEFAPTEAEDRYELEEEFKQCIMEDAHGNPTDWFNKLDEINSRFSNIEHGKFQKDEEDIKLHIRMNLPEDLYSEVITSFKDYSSMSLRQVKKDIKSYHRRLKRADKIKESKVNKIMQVEIRDTNQKYGQRNNNYSQRNNRSKWSRPFKGNCHYCGEQGHKAINCPKRRGDNPEKRPIKTSIKCFICGKNHYANQCPLRKGKIEQAANVFVGAIHVKEEEKVMMDYDHNSDEELDESHDIENALEEEENKVDEAETKEKQNLMMKINTMSDRDKVLLTNVILSSVGSKTLFVPESDEKLNPQVEKIAKELLTEWIESDFKVLKKEYDFFVEEKNKTDNEKIQKRDDWKVILASGAKSESTLEVKKAEDLKVVSAVQNYYDSLSDDDNQSEASYEIGDQWKNGKLITGESMDEDEAERVNATMIRDHIEDYFGFPKKKKKKKKKKNTFIKNNNHRGNKKGHKTFDKTDLKSQWIDMRE